jgi:quercetin dioxygenase-like cupin family protein
MAFVDPPEFKPLLAHPDDHRPNSRWALMVDPTSPDGAFVRNVTIVRETIAPGDGIPLHQHPEEEAILIEEGTSHFRLGDETRDVEAGAVVSIPSLVPHGSHNNTDKDLRVTSFIPSPVITLEYLERNPAPGTEGASPQPIQTIDPRASQA